MASLEETLARLRQAQENSFVHQRQIADSINTAVAGGIGGLSAVADALDSLRQSPGQLPPLGTSPGDSYGQPAAYHHALANMAQAQLDASNRNAHVAQAVTAAVIGGTDALGQVAAGLRQLNERPQAIEHEALQPQYQQSLEWLQRQTSAGDTPAPVYPTPQVMICPTCNGSGRVTYG